MRLIVRITDKSGSRIERHTLTDKPLTIGRAWDNDIILSDQFVDADHLSVGLRRTDDDSVGIELNDLQTTNGTTAANKRIVGDSHRYRLGSLIKIGDTNIEIFDASTPVEKTAVRSLLFFLRERFHSLSSLLWLTLVALVIVIIDGQFLTAEPTKLSNALLTMSLTLLFLFVWSLVFGFISKLLRGESNVRAHWALACITTITFTLLAWLFLIIRFNLQSVDLSLAILALGMGSVSVLLLYALFTYATNLSVRAKSLCSVFIVVGVVAATYSDILFKEPHQRWTAQGQIEAVNLPPAFMLREARDLDQYMQDTSSLFKALDSAVEQ